MRLDVRRALLTIRSPHIGLEKINHMLRIAQEYDICNVSVELNQEDTRFAILFTKVRTSLFVEEWVKFWMRSFNVEYDLDFEVPENGPSVTGSRVSPV